MILRHEQKSLEIINNFSKDARNKVNIRNNCISIHYQKSKKNQNMVYKTIKKKKKKNLRIKFNEKCRLSALNTRKHC